LVGQLLINSAGYIVGINNDVSYRDRYSYIYDKDLIIDDSKIDYRLPIKDDLDIIFKNSIISTNDDCLKLNLNLDEEGYDWLIISSDNHLKNNEFILVNGKYISALSSYNVLFFTETIDRERIPVSSGKYYILVDENGTLFKSKTSDILDVSGYLSLGEIEFNATTGRLYYPGDSTRSEVNDLRPRGLISNNLLIPRLFKYTQQLAYNMNFHIKRTTTGDSEIFLSYYPDGGVTSFTIDKFYRNTGWQPIKIVTIT